MAAQEGRVEVDKQAPKRQTDRVPDWAPLLSCMDLGIVRKEASSNLVLREACPYRHYNPGLDADA